MQRHERTLLARGLTASELRTVAPRATRTYTHTKTLTIASILHEQTYGDFRRALGYEDEGGEGEEEATLQSSTSPSTSATQSTPASPESPASLAPTRLQRLAALLTPALTSTTTAATTARNSTQKEEKRDGESEESKEDALARLIAVDCGEGAGVVELAAAVVSTAGLCHLQHAIPPSEFLRRCDQVLLSPSPLTPHVLSCPCAYILRYILRINLTHNSYA